MFGIDRFYLGYPAIGKSVDTNIHLQNRLCLGLLKLCTIGFFFVGQLVDFLLILVQAVGPSDRSAYYAAFYGPLISQVNTTNSYLEVSDAPCV